MRSALTALPQMAVMAAIVATLMYLPVCIALALMLRTFGISFEAWLTLGATLHPALGLLAWWLLVFLGSCGFAAWVFPWRDQVSAAYQSRTGRCDAIGGRIAGRDRNCR